MESTVSTEGQLASTIEGQSCPECGEGAVSSEPANPAGTAANRQQSLVHWCANWHSWATRVDRPSSAGWPAWRPGEP